MPKEIEKLSLTSFLQNPSGNSTSYMANRSMIRENLSLKYTNLIREFGEFKYKIFKKGDNFVFYFKIPSEHFHDKRMYYDVVIEFYPITSDDITKKSIANNYHMRFFSNSPNFTFTYAYVLYQNDMIFEDLIKKIPDKAKRMAPTTRNPVQQMGFEKTCYYACLFIKNRKDLTSIDYLNKNSENYNNLLMRNRFLKDIMDCEDKLSQYNKYESINVKYRRKEKQKKIKENNKKIAKAFNKNTSHNMIQTMTQSLSHSMKTKSHSMKHDMSIKKRKK